jgi:hypothetical protein
MSEENIAGLSNEEPTEELSEITWAVWFTELISLWKAWGELITIIQETSCKTIISCQPLKLVSREIVFQTIYLPENYLFFVRQLDVYDIPTSKLKNRTSQRQSFFIKNKIYNMTIMNVNRFLTVIALSVSVFFLDIEALLDGS